MKAISRRLGVFKFCGRNPKIVGRRLTHVTTPHRNNSSNSGRSRKQGLKNKLRGRADRRVSRASARLETGQAQVPGLSEFSTLRNHGSPCACPPIMAAGAPV